MRLKIKGIAKARLASLAYDKCATVSVGDGVSVDLKYAEMGECYPKEGQEDFTNLVILRSEHTHGNFRWRFAGAFAGRHHVAKALFDYPDDVTHQEIKLMEDVVGVIEGILDGILRTNIENGELLEEQRRERKRKEEIRRAEANAREVRALIPQQEDEQTGDHLYLMKHSNGLTKIGRSKRPKAREKTLQAEDPRLELIYTAENLGWLERKFHKMLSEERVRGEWFRLEEHRIDWIKFYCENKAKAEMSLELEDQ